MALLQSDALLLCLLASLIWAPFVYGAALMLDRKQTLKTSETIWLGALAAAVLPTLLAPAFSAAGISLRPAAPVAAETNSAAGLVAASNEVMDAQPASYSSAPSAAPASDTAMAPAEATYWNDTAPAQTSNQAAAIEEAPLAAATDAAPGLFSALSAISVETIMNMAGLLYLYGALLAFGIWAMRCIGFAYNTLRAKNVSDPTLLDAVNVWRNQMGVRQTLRIKESPSISSVCVTGYLQPVILIPAGIRGRVAFDDLVMMCAHELAHIKRGDVRLFTIAAAARILFWFNPFIKRITARAELAAEQCADGLVVSSGVERRAYAACFVEGLRFAARRPTQSFAALPSFTPLDRKGRRKRLDSILSSKFNGALSMRTRLMLSAAGLAAAGAVFTQAAIAVHPETNVNAEGVLSQLPVSGRLTLSHGSEWKDKASGKIKGPHQGIDIAAKRGTDIVAPGAGVVVAATDLYQGKPDWGKVIVIDHGNGVKTRYAHLDSYAVLKGDRVWSGDKIGKVGSTGRSTGPHLHFETLVEGKSVDPLATMGIDVEDITAPIAQATPEAALAPVIAPMPEVAPMPDEAAAPLPATSSLEAALEGAEEAMIIVRPSLEIIGDVIDDTGEIMGDLQADLLDENIIADLIDALPDNIDEEMDMEIFSIKPQYIDKPQPRTKSFTGSYKGGKPLSNARRIAIEHALAEMRVEMHAAQHARRHTHRTARHARQDGYEKNKKKYEKHTRKALIKTHKKDDMQKRHAQQMVFAFTKQHNNQEQLLKMRDVALANARRSLQQAQRQMDRNLAQAERGLNQSEKSLLGDKLAKKDIERFKEAFTEARKDLQDQRQEKLAALREAEKTIEAQQQEIDRLRAELSQQQ